MKKYTVTIDFKDASTVVVQAMSLKEALKELQITCPIPNVKWDLFPTYLGDKLLNTSLKVAGKSFKVTIVSEEF